MDEILSLIIFIWLTDDCELDENLKDIKDHISCVAAEQQVNRFKQRVKAFYIQLQTNYM